MSRPSHHGPSFIAGVIMAASIYDGVPLWVTLPAAVGLMLACNAIDRWRRR